MKAILVPPKGPCKMLIINSLEDMQKAVGGYIERIPLPNACGYVNEEGRINGLPLNPRATKLWYKALGLSDFGKALAEEDGHSLCGPLLIMGLEDVEGENTDCPDPKTLGLEVEI